MASAELPQHSGTPGSVGPFLTASEVADILRIELWAAVKLCREGKLAATKPGKQWLIAPADLDAYIAAGRNVAVSA